MGLKLLHSADWHLDSPFAGFPEELRQRLREEQRQLPWRIADLCCREQCDLVLLSGDLFDREPSRRTLEDLKQALARCGVIVFISPGNHDFCCPGSPWLEESWPDNVRIFTGGVTSVALPELGCRIWGAGFQAMDCGSLLEGFRAEGPEPCQIGLFHGDPVQPGSPYNGVTASQVRESGLDYLALGHIHRAGSFTAGKTLCAWPGCPMGRGWDETGKKGVYLVTADDRGFRLETAGVEGPAFYDLTADAGGDGAGALEALLPGAASSDFYRVTLTGQGPVDMQALQQIRERIPNLQLHDRTQPPLDLWAEADADTLEGVYFRLLRRRLAEADPEDARQILLAAQISRQLLEGREVVLP